MSTAWDLLLCMTWPPIDCYGEATYCGCCLDTLRLRPHKFAGDVTVRQAIRCGHWLLQGWGGLGHNVSIWSVWPHPYCCSNRSRAVQPDLTKYSGIWATMGGWDVFSGLWKHLQQPNASKLYGATTAHLGNIVPLGVCHLIFP